MPVSHPARRVFLEAKNPERKEEKKNKTVGERFINFSLTLKKVNTAERTARIRRVIASDNKRADM